MSAATTTNDSDRTVLVIALLALLGAVLVVAGVLLGVVISGRGATGCASSDGGVVCKCDGEVGPQPELRGQAQGKVTLNTNVPIPFGTTVGIYYDANGNDELDNADRCVKTAPVDPSTGAYVADFIRPQCPAPCPSEKYIARFVMQTSPTSPPKDVLFTCDPQVDTCNKTFDVNFP